MRHQPHPPHPELLRKPTGAFGWLDARLLHDRWLANLGSEASAVLLLLALAADRHGASFHGRGTMAKALSITEPEIDQALTRLLELGLLAHRPWSAGNPDGVWQLLPLPRRQGDQRQQAPTSIGAALAALGLTQ